YWVACTPSHAYQFTFWSPWTDRVSLTADAEAWMNSFRQLSVEKNMEAQRACEDGEFPADGFALRGLAGAGWVHNNSGVFADSEVAILKNANGFSLKCYPLPANVKVRPAELDAILLKTQEVTEQEKTNSPKPVTKDGIEGRLYEFDRKIDNHDYHFKVRIFQQPAMAHLVVTWGFKKTPERERDESLAYFHLSAPDPKSPARFLTQDWKKARAFFHNDLGIAHYRRQDYRDAASLFHEAARLLDTDDSIAGNLVDAVEMQGKAGEALEIIFKEFTDAMRANVSIRARQASLQARTGQADAALTTWKALFADDYQNEDHLLAWINLLLDNNKPADALRAVETYGDRHPSKKLDRWTASVLARNDRFDDAFKKLETQISTTPPDVDGLYLLGELQNEAGRYEDAEKTATRLLAAGEDTARTHVLRGWSEWHRKAWKAAHESFTKASGKSPEDSTIKEALAMSAGALGQGGADLSKTPLDPVAIPKRVEDALDALPELPAELAQGHGATYARRVTGIFYQSGKPVRVTQYYKVKILDQTGLESFSTMSQSFEPASEKVYVNRLIVKDETGKVIQEGSNADAYATGETGDLATGAQIMRIPVPGLRRGCTLEVAITVEDKSKSTKPPFRRDLMVSGFPAAARAWFVQGDTSAMKFSAQGGLKPVDGEGFRAFVIGGTRAYQREPLSAPLEDWNPVIVAGPAGGDWKELSADYLKRLEDRLEPDEATKALADRICRNLTTPAEKFGAIIRHVQSTLTYKGLEFGPRGQIPSPVSKILTDQYGDCKDHTFLLYHLLRRAGIACSPALVDTDWRLRRDLPSLDQFNHMILHVPGVGPQPWIDATDDWLDLTQYVPESLGGRQALVMDSAGGHLETIPETPATLIKIDRTAKLVSPSGSALAMDETLTLTGAAASWARGWFLSAAESEYINMVRRQLDSSGSFDLSRVELKNAQDQSLPFIIRLTYTVPDAFAPGSRQLSIPFLWERDYLAVSPAENRQSPFRIQPATRIESTFRLTGLSATPVVNAAPASAAALEIDENSATPSSGTLMEGKWELTSAPDGGDWLVSLKTESRAGDFPVSDWTAFQKSHRTLTERLRRMSVTLP
ncbi:MAG: hypothetical protein JWL81_464, partial [Verrucomicrobiales bacterium]|nr:hypothetical protein [Verrucomicrobiales bacterium]